MGARGSVVGWGTTATSRKVAGSIPDVTGFFYLPNPFSRTMDLGSTQPLTETSTRNLPGVKGRPAHKADNPTTICETSRKSGSPDVSQPYGPPRPVTGIALPFYGSQMLPSLTRIAKWYDYSVSPTASGGEEIDWRMELLQKRHVLVSLWKESTCNKVLIVEEWHTIYRIQ
jgi:hypothetical protein